MLINYFFNLKMLIVSIWCVNSQYHRVNSQCMDVNNQYQVALIISIRSVNSQYQVALIFSINIIVKPLLTQANQGTLLRRHNPYIRTHPSLRSGAARTTCYAVARIGSEKKERGSCNSHPSFYYSEFKLYFLSRKLSIEIPNIRPAFNWKKFLTYANFHL